MLVNLEKKLNRIREILEFYICFFFFEKKEYYKVFRNHLKRLSFKTPRSLQEKERRQQQQKKHQNKLTMQVLQHFVDNNNNNCYNSLSLRI